MHYPKNLPISAEKNTIIKAVKNHQVVVIAGDTGSGKTTQLPKMCLEAGRGTRGMIGCTQPRRIAAVSVAERVRQELGQPDLVGYTIRFNDRTSADTKIKFMTDGILLAETRGDRTLSRYDTLIIDEAHERSLNIDFLLGYLHQLLEVRNDLKILISSATIDTEKFSHHFADAPVIEVSGRTYPVTYHYHPPESTSEEDDLNMVDQAVAQVLSLADRPGGGDILIFMPTERDILDTVALLHKKITSPALILPLFGRLQGADQRKIFQPSALRKIIAATNVAETSITIPGIQSVVDTGLARISRYNVRAGTTSLPVSRVSRASCDQRAGRCGRTGPGDCIRLYSEEDYHGRPDFTQPELLRSNLAEVILQMISLSLGDPRKFPFIDPPAPRAINDGYRILRELGAITKDNRLTKRGRIMAGLPLDPRISRMIIAGAELGVLREISIIAAVLSIQDPRIRPVDKIQQAQQAQQKFIKPGSDILTLINIWDSCKQAMAGKHPSSGLRKFCKTNFCSWQRMREWFDIHDQIIRTIKHYKGFTLNTEPGSSAAVHQALTAGFLRNIGMRKKKNNYQISGNREAVLFPGSSLYNQGGQWIVAVDFVHTSQLFARVVANIDVSWLERLGGDLCKRSWSDPHWQKKSGQVMALEKVSLFGLILSSGRRVNYGRVNTTKAAEAREIFIRQALLQGELQGKYPFLQHNLELTHRFAEMEERLRRRGIMMDEQVLYDFYDSRLPLVYDLFTLNRFLKKNRNDHALFMQEEDICQQAPDSNELYRFPNSLQTSRGGLKLSYRFQPGHEEDGVTVEIPADLYSNLTPAVFEWLVPGLLEEKIFFLLKGLPKRLRKMFVPLPDAVDRIIDGLDLYQDSLYPALERSILRRFQVNINRSDWQIDNLPSHLRMRFRLCDEKGKMLHSNRSFHELAPYCISPASAPHRSTASKLPKKTGITHWQNQPAPDPIARVDRRTETSTLYYPTLTINEADRSLTLHYIVDQSKAQHNNRAGLQFLYSLEFSQEIKALKKECKAAVASHSASWISLGVKGKAAELRNALSACVLSEVFQTGSGELPDSNQFNQTLHTIKEKGILKQSRKIINEILELLAARRKTQIILTSCRQRTAKISGSGEEQSAHFQKLLDQLLPRDFLLTVPPKHFHDINRYLRALALRIERAEHSPTKDAKKSLKLQPMLKRLQEINSQTNKSTSCLEATALYRRMVEEYRVSVFAPELGTAFPVSEKRLSVQWQKLTDSCRTVE